MVVHKLRFLPCFASNIAYGLSILCSQSARQKNIEYKQLLIHSFAPEITLFLLTFQWQETVMWPYLQAQRLGNMISTYIASCQQKFSTLKGGTQTLLAIYLTKVQKESQDII